VLGQNAILRVKKKAPRRGVGLKPKLNMKNLVKKSYLVKGKNEG
jgi:hypothetical protein